MIGATLRILSSNNCNPCRTDAPWRLLMSHFHFHFAGRINMDSVVRFLSFGLQLSVCQALVCSAPFKDILGVCLNFTTTGMTWCEAQHFCWTVGGELVRGSSFLPLNGKKFTGMPYNYWIGLTDFLIERKKNRDGWQWSDGTTNPSSSMLAWGSGQPSTNDCIRQYYGAGKLYTAPCGWAATPVCQPRIQLSSAGQCKSFKPVSVPVGLAVDEFAEGDGCSKLISNIEVILDCAVFCHIEPKESCVSFYFNEAKKECRMVLYTDATINMGNAQGWKKFILNK